MHPLTKEKIAIKGLADRVRNMKTTLELGTLYKEPEVTSAMQHRMARLSRAIRHRHIAYCLVRQGIDGIDKAVVHRAGIETKYTAEEFNWGLVMHHRIRLSNAVMKYQGEHIERLLQSHFKQTPAKPMIMGLGHFEKDTDGNFVSPPAPADGTVYIMPCYPGAEKTEVREGEDMYDALIRTMRPFGFCQNEGEERILKMVLTGEVDSATFMPIDDDDDLRETHSMLIENPCDEDLQDEFFAAGERCDGCKDCTCDETKELSKEEWDRLGVIAKCENEMMDGLINIVSGELEEDIFYGYEEVEKLLNETDMEDQDGRKLSKCAMTSDLVEPRGEDWANYSGVDITKPHECPYLGEYFNTDFECKVGGICDFHDHFAHCHAYLLCSQFISPPFLNS